MKQVVIMPIAEGSEHLFPSNSKFVYPGDDVTIINKDSIVVLGGGEDISPSIYGQKPSKYTYAGEQLSRRDAREVAAVQRAIEVEAGVVGLCRGAQLICALAGGTLFQHATRHVQDHEMCLGRYDYNARYPLEVQQQMDTNSIHHQIMDISRIWEEVDILGWANQESAYFDYNQQKMVDPNKPILELEVAYFKSIRGLGFQGHPEYQSAPKKLSNYARAMIKKYFY